MNTENNRRAGLPEMLQDCDRKLSMALSNTPGARLHATEAAAAVNSKPVAWIEHHKAGDNLNWEQVDHPYAMATPLYTAPMTALSYEQIDAIAKAQDDDPQEPWFTRQLTKLEWRCFARDIERACSPGAAPPADTAIEPLSDEQIEPLFRQINDMRVVGEKDEWFWFAWGVEMGERAHGIRSSGARHSAGTDRPGSDEKDVDYWNEKDVDYWIRQFTAARSAELELRRESESDAALLREAMEAIEIGRYYAATAARQFIREAGINAKVSDDKQVSQIDATLSKLRERLKEA
jgi:hypothetical protein